MKPRTSLVAFCFVVIVCSLFAGSIYHYYDDQTNESIGLEPLPPAPNVPRLNPSKVKKKDPHSVCTGVNYGPYMADLERRIKRVWYPPKSLGPYGTMVEFKIKNNGLMSDLFVKNSSRYVAADRAALKAVQTAAPFRSLPKGAPEEVSVQFTFDYRSNSVNTGKQFEVVTYPKN